MPRKGFPQISSLPSFRQSTSSLRHGDQIPRSFESENIKDLPPGSSPFANKSKQKKEDENWTPISISSGSDSDNGDERQDKVGSEFYDCLLVETMTCYKR